MSPRPHRRLGIASVLLGVLALILAGAPVASGAGSPLRPLLPLARGRLLVSLGPAPQWLPVSGRPLTVTVFSGRPAARLPGGANAYLALQGAGQPCAVSAAADHVRPLHVVPRFYDSRNLISRQASPFAPDGGAAAGDFSASLPGIVVRQRGQTRVCVWLATSPRGGGLSADQRVPLLDGLFAASVSALPDASRASAGYTMDAESVSRAFRVVVSGKACGSPYDERPQPVPAGAPISETVVGGDGSCPGDETTFAFAAGGLLGSLTYTSLAALSESPPVVSLGGCELDPVTGTRVAVATGYVRAIGCTVSHLLVAPFQSGVPRGAVLEAQVDGGVADAAPRGTAVDLVVNGAP